MRTTRSPRGFWSQQLTDADYIERWKAKCVITPSGCWLWQGFCHKFRGIKPGQRGYPAGSYRARNVRLHRQVLEITVRPLKPGEVACHTCDSPPCINPAHLWIGTQKDNIRDGIAKGKQQFHKDHYTKCHRGHEFTPENTRIDARGWRQCRICQRIICRVRAGWSLEEAMAMPLLPPGTRTRRRTFGKRSTQNGE